MAQVQASSNGAQWLDDEIKGMFSKKILERLNRDNDEKKMNQMNLQRKIRNQKEIAKQLPGKQIGKWHSSLKEAKDSTRLLARKGIDKMTVQEKVDVRQRMIKAAESSMGGKLNRKTLQQMERYSGGLVSSAEIGKILGKKDSRPAPHNQYSTLAEKMFENPLVEGPPTISHQPLPSPSSPPAKLSRRQRERTLDKAAADDKDQEKDKDKEKEKEKEKETGKEPAVSDSKSKRKRARGKKKNAAS